MKACVCVCMYGGGGVGGGDCCDIVGLCSFPSRGKKKRKKTKTCMKELVQL